MIFVVIGEVFGLSTQTDKRQKFQKRVASWARSVISPII